MEIAKTGINTINITDNYKQETKSKTEDKKEFKENGSAIIVTLTAAAAIAMGIIAARKGKTSAVKETVTNLADDVVKAAKNSADDVVKAAKNSADDVIKASKVAETAKAAVKEGANYSAVKEAALKNHTKQGKEIIKASLKEAKNEVLNAENAVRTEMKANAETMKSAIGSIKSAAQGQSKTVEQAMQRAEVLKSGLDDVTQASKKAVENAINNPTAHNKKVAVHMQNQANEFTAKAQQAIKKEQNKAKALAEEAAKKELNKAQFIASQTPESVEIMQRNAAQASRNAIKRDVKNELKKLNPVIEDLKRRRFSPEKLQQIADMQAPNKQFNEKMIRAAQYMVKGLA